jgi:hypothetical protein
MKLFCMLISKEQLYQTVFCLSGKPCPQQLASPWVSASAGLTQRQGHTPSQLCISISISDSPAVHKHHV